MGNFISSQEEEEEEDPYFDIISHWNQLHQKQEDPEPFDLTELSQEVLWKVLDKVNYTDYAVLEESSRSLEIACNARKFGRPYLVPTIYVNKKTVSFSTTDYYYYESCHPRVPWHVATSQAVRIRADTVNINFRASSRRIQAVSKLFERNKTTAEVLNLHQHILFAPADLDRLIKILEVSHLDCRQFMPKEFFQSSVLQNLNSMTLDSSGCTDDELVKLKMDYMYMSNDFITARGLNRFLKQWKKKEREISVIDIEFDSSFGTRDFEVILEDLGANPIWTPAYHSDSLISCISLEEYHPMKTGDPEHLYSLFRSEDIGNIRLIRLRQGRFETFYTHSENAFLLSYLDDDQYYAVMKRCMCCDTEFCDHRRRFSSQRFKKAYPNIYEKIITGVMMLSDIFSVARTSQLVLGAPSVPVQPMDDYHYERFLQEHRTESKVEKFLLDLQLVFFNC